MYTKIKCDLCGTDCAPDGAGGVYIDGKTLYGPWAKMCVHCHKAHGGKLGTGIGQKYELTPNIVSSYVGIASGLYWKKVAG